MFKKRIFTQEEIKDIINMYESGTTIKQIREKYRCKSNKISQILKENNIKIKNVTDYFNSKQLATTKKYKFNEDYFEKIDTPDKAYWLGFIYADGNVFIKKGKSENSSKGATIEISLKREDEYHLNNFIKCLKGNISLKTREVKLNGNIYPASRLLINSIKMANDLIQLGCIPRKSLVLTFPQNLSENLYSHFIRGYFDGDGCISFKRYNKSFSFVATINGTYDFLSQIKIILQDNKIKSSDVKSTKSKAYEIRLYGKDNLAKLHNYLYKDAEYFLGRKFDLFRSSLFSLNQEFEASDVAKCFIKLLLEDAV